MSILMPNQALSIRPASAADGPFLYALYASTRAAELAAWGWDAAMQTQFLQLQFRAQQQHYASYPNPVHWIIEHHAPNAQAAATATDAQQLVQPIGRVLLSFCSDEIRLVDIALLPEFRSRGIGAALVGWVQAQARAEGKAVRLHVSPENRARSLYERLGFRLVEDRQSHLFMEWLIPPTAATERNEPAYAG